MFRAFYLDMDPGGTPAAELRLARSVTRWKMIASAAAGAALSTVLIFTLGDDDGHEAGDTSAARVASDAGRLEPSFASAAENGEEDEGEEGGASAAAQAGEPTSTTTTSSAELDAATTGADAAAERALATPAVRTATGAPAAPAEAGAEEPGATTSATEGAPPADAGAPERAQAEGRASDAGAQPNAWASPPMSAGAGRFVTEAPYWGASSFVPNPNAGAGRFMTEAPPWSASALTPDPNAGAGPFTTERNLPAFGIMFGYWPLFPLPGARSEPTAPLASPPSP